ncbi:MAG: rod shape-determining protein RodA [Armatimonadota bacterium]|nr:rod shape-determining protein RodA [Armatimonadota bacterium]MDR7427803.1 rod shape-determining protein RodA [Armatimonadota bacterium]MDR7463120.1 rod shape-determining protein RodA [Armatimonadota bacterium]MDR7468893.1 rod shape-determining protein RodA [Armatimonadota bacterium]MDR7474866.1 rod shape-determining protein RodA [Armatimonadota bacterium]
MRRVLRALDMPLLVTTGLLVAFGLVALASAAVPLGGPWAYVRTRLLHLAFALGAMVAAALVDYRRLAGYSRWLYAAMLVLLVAVLLLGVTRLGAQRWIPLGPLGGFQPSELAKIVLVLSLARSLSTQPLPSTLSDLLAPLAHVGIPMVLIFRQPDMGSAMVLGAILLGMLFLAGVRLRLLVGLGGLGLMGAPFLWSALRDYQRQRLLVFLDPGIDPLGAGYALNQAKIAVGSGQIWGKGVFAGTQNLLRFIPEQHTDFIFTVIGEEMGFVGGVLLLLLFLIWIWRALQIAYTAADRLGMLVAGGIAVMTVFHVFVNIGMTVGLMPITGIPLPFISYGGSSLLTMGVATGLLLGIGARRRKILL